MELWKYNNLWLMHYVRCRKEKEKLKKETNKGNWERNMEMKRKDFKNWLYYKWNPERM